MENTLSHSDVQFIENQLKKFPLESITIGDAGEINNCQVGRLMEDQPRQIPKMLNDELAKPVLELYSTAQAFDFFNKFLESGKEQFVRRSQFNLLGKGSFVGRHLDIDSNPDYKIAAVLQLGSVFSGGEFVVYPSKKSTIEESQVVCPEYGSLTVSFCNYEHEVKEVTSGTRTICMLYIKQQ